MADLYRYINDLNNRINELNDKLNAASFGSSMNASELQQSILSEVKSLIPAPLTPRLSKRPSWKK